MNLPLDTLRYEIIDRIIPKSFVERFKTNKNEYITLKNIRDDVKLVFKLITLNKKIYNIYKQLLIDFKTIYNLCCKYDAYKEYHKRTGAITGLYDALSTNDGLPFVKYSFPRYTKEIENDIKTFILLFPQSVHFDDGIMRCRDNVSSLYIWHVQIIQIFHYILLNYY